MKATLFIIENDKDHAQAKALIEKLMGSDEVADRARMAAQARLIEAYERARWPRRTTTLPDLLTYLMDQHGLSRADLVPLVGTASRVSEVLNGKRELSMSMVRNLRERFRISADLLISSKRSTICRHSRRVSPSGAICRPMASGTSTPHSSLAAALAIATSAPPRAARSANSARTVDLPLPGGPSNRPNSERLSQRKSRRARASACTGLLASDCRTAAGVKMGRCKPQ